jgi:hypothetical protein
VAVDCADFQRYCKLAQRVKTATLRECKIHWTSF